MCVCVLCCGNRRRHSGLQFIKEITGLKLHTIATNSDAVTWETKHKSRQFIFQAKFLHTNFNLNMEQPARGSNIKANLFKFTVFSRRESESKK